MQKDISFTFEFALFIKEEYDVEKITALLKIEPSRKWIMNEHIRGVMYRKDSGWELASEELFGYYSLEEPFRGFIKKIEDVLPLIKKIMHDDDLSCQIDIVIKIYSGETMPGIHLDSGILNLLSSFNCSLNFDMYDNRER